MVTGAGGLNAPVAVVYSGDCTNVTVANGCTATATFAGDANHNGSSDAKSITITKADSTTVVTFEAGPYVYRGTAFTATAVVTGAGGLNQSVAVVYTGDCTNVTVANGCTATATFAGDANHNGSSDAMSITITKATSTTVVTFEAGPYVYRGTAFTATAVVTGVGGLNQSVAVVYSGDCTNVTSADGCTATATFAGDANHNGSSDAMSITITKADSTTVVTFEAGPYVYRGTAFTATAVVTGVGGLNQAVAVVYSGDCLNVTSANGCTATANFAGDTNHFGSSDAMSITITKADATCSISGYNGVFDGVYHGASGSCSGIGGESAGTLNLGATYKYPPGGTAHWVFTGNGNYKDQSGDVSILIIAWHFGGFFQPVDMNGVFNVVKGGSTVPLKFQVFAGNTELTDTNAIIGFTYGTVACNSSAISDDIETLATGGTTLRYDFTAGQFIYNWKTPKTPGCYSLVMTTVDHSTLLAYFKIK